MPITMSCPVEESLRRTVLVLPVVVCFAGCITVGGRDLSEAEVNSEGQNVSMNPDEARIITSDIDNFWLAYDDANPEHDTRIQG